MATLRKFPRVSQIVFRRGTVSEFDRWICNRCYADVDPKEAWAHGCGQVCECGHTFHQSNLCPGRRVHPLGYSRRFSCYCSIAAPIYKI